MIFKRLVLVLAILSFTAILFASDNKHGDFVYTSGTDLMLNGKPFRYVGGNNYYLMVYATTPEFRKDVDEIFDSAEKMSLKVIRTWAFNDGQRQWNALQTSPGSFRESTFIGLDRVIAKAKEKNIRLILTLTNCLSDYGGIKQYVDWCPTCVTKDKNDFFTDANTRQYYKDFVKTVLTRKNTITGMEYRDDPTIMAWQLMNEPVVENDLSGDKLYNWFKEMSGYIKSIDKNHLVMTGEEGFYANANKYDWKLNGTRGQDFIRDHSIPTIDIASFHVWPSSNKYNMESPQIIEWVKRHVEDAKRIGKPVIVDEYGEYRGFNGDTVERDRVYKLLLAKFEELGIDGSNFWQLLHKKYKNYDDGYGVYYPDDASTVEIIKSAAKKANIE